MSGELDPDDPDMRHRQVLARAFSIGILLILAAMWFLGKALP